MGEIFLRSGRTIAANRGLVGINDKLEIAEGYDGGIDWNFPDHPHYDEDEPSKYSVTDMEELADIMIARWQRFKAKLREAPPTPREGEAK